MKLLVIKPSSLGDILHTYPAVALLIRQFPDVEITWVVNEGLKGMVELFPGLAKILVFPRKSLKRLPSFLKELRTETYDAVIDFQGLLRSGLIARAARTTYPARRYGFAAAREGAPLFYTHKIKTPPEIIHAADKNIFLAATFANVPFHPAGEFPELAIPEEVMQRAQSLLDISSKRPVLAVCFSSRWSSKDWPLPFFADVLHRLARQIPNVKIWLLGSAEDRAKGDSLAALAGSDDTDVTNLAGQTSLLELTAMLKASNAMLTVDSGPMHLAAALNVPCVALFGATSPEKTGPYGTCHHVIVSKCRHAPCFRRRCPHPEEGGCNFGTDAADVADILTEILAVQNTPIINQEKQ